MYMLRGVIRGMTRRCASRDRGFGTFGLARPIPLWSEAGRRMRGRIILPHSRSGLGPDRREIPKAFTSWGCCTPAGKAFSPEPRRCGRLLSAGGGAGPCRGTTSAQPDSSNRPPRQPVTGFERWYRTAAERDRRAAEHNRRAPLSERPRRDAGPCRGAALEPGGRRARACRCASQYWADLCARHWLRMGLCGGPALVPARRRAGQCRRASLGSASSTPMVMA